MDVPSLANAVMQVLSSVAPLLGGVGAAIATDVGDSLYDAGKQQAKRLFEAINHRFSQEKDGGRATQALQTFVSGDLDYGDVVQKKLERILQQDPDFANSLLQLIRSGPLQSLIVGEEGVARDIDISNSAGHGTQQIETGKKSQAERIRLNITSPDHH